MACYRPILTNKIEKGKKPIFQKINNEKNYKQELNYNWKTTEKLPCKKCIGCKTDNAREWAIRAALQTKYTKNNYFITLTYTEKYKPNNSSVLNKELTTFIKSLRKHFERLGHKGIKYIASNEYGTKTKRPHYHICFFNLPLTDLKETGEKNKIEQPYYISKTIDKIWNKGMHKIGIVNYESAGYVARYTLKKLEKIDYKNLNIEPEKLRMSKGIGLDYFNEKQKEIYKYDYVTIQTKNGTINLKPPKYYDRKLKETKPELLEKLKIKRIKLAKIKLNEKMINTKTSYIETMANEQRKLYKNLKNLKRKIKNNN